MTRDAFNNIVHNTCRKLYRIAFRMLMNQQEAEDAVQEVFMKMWMMRGKLDNYNDIEALAVTMTRNGAIDMIRRRKHGVSFQPGPGTSGDEMARSPFELMVDSETGRILKEIIDRLPPNFREIVIMKEIEGLSYEEIASVTSVNINSLRVTVSRARQMIREQFIQYSYERRKAQGTT